METEIKIAAKIYQCRDTAKKLHGDGYEKEMSDYKHYIKACMAKFKFKNEIEAAMQLIKDCDGDGVATINILSALAEILEPSKK
jgi:hypothetical protein